MTESTLGTPPGLLARAIKAVPSVRYALGIGGIISVIAIISSFRISFSIAFISAVVMFILMTMLVIFASLAGQASSSFKLPALVFTWFCLLLFMATAITLFAAVFWGSPAEVRQRFGLEPVAVQQKQPPRTEPLEPQKT